MYAAKCLTVLVVVAVLAVMWILHRRKTNQVMLAIAAAILVGGVVRLFQIRDSTQTVYTVGLILAALVAVWVASWLSNRAAVRRGRQADAGADKGPRGTSRT